MLLWDGEKFFDEPDKAKAKKLIEKGEAQDVSREDGLSLKYRHQFPQYKTRELRAEAPVEKPAAKVNWEDHKDEYKADTGAKRATKDAVLAWLKGRS